MSSPTDQAPANPLRLWPAIVILVLLWLGVTVPLRVMTFGPDLIVAFMAAMGTPLLAYFVWWIGFSRVPVLDRVLGLLLLVAAIGVGVAVLFHPTAIKGLAIPTVLLPTALTAATAGMWLGRNLPWRRARVLGVAGLLLAVFGWSTIRVKGSDGGLMIHFAPRWQPSAEELFLSEQGTQQPEVNESSDAEPAAHVVALQPGDWPGFRGAGRDSHLEGQVFATNWDENPPVELWRHRVGPAWSSFTVVDGLLITQEQRGENECVVCYNADDGHEVWNAAVEARFYAPESGAGPLATPTFHEGALYTTGGTGVVQRIDAATGQVAWRRQLTDDLPRQAPPDWGFASSPLVVESDDSAQVVVFAGNPPPEAGVQAVNDHAVIAYDAETGEPKWTAGAGWHGYCSPVLATLDGVEQLLIGTNDGLESLTPTSGQRLWFYEWSTGPYPRIALPTVNGPDAITLAAGYGYGAQGLRVRQDAGDWKIDAFWETRLLKPYFNDFLYYQGHNYGFDDKFFTCLDAETGELTWSKRTRRQTQFGCGQVLLIEDMQVLLVLTELTGEVVLLKADPSQPVELARLKVLEGKTWNHPVVAHGRLYVRNDAEMACYQLPGVTDPASGSQEVASTE